MRRKHLCVCEEFRRKGLERLHIGLHIPEEIARDVCLQGRGLRHRGREHALHRRLGHGGDGRLLLRVRLLDDMGQVLLLVDADGCERPDQREDHDQHQIEDLLLQAADFDSVNDFCRVNHLNYLPFVGKITGRPSVLEGSLEEMINEANAYIAKGVYGIDLLGYRYTGDAALLNREFVKNMEVPVCIAGSVNSYERLQEIKDVSPWAFTIGGAFFENKFDGTMKEQIDKVYNFMKE